MDCVGLYLRNHLILKSLQLLGSYKGDASERLIRWLLRAN